MDRALRSLATFLLGLVVGVLATFAAFSGRVASLETASSMQTQQLQDMSISIRVMRDEMASIQALINAKK